MQPAVHKKHPVRNAILLILLVLILAGAGYLGVKAMKAKYTVIYTPYTVRQGNLTDSTTYDSSVSLIDMQNETASSDGKVRKVSVAAGDTVKKGDLLLQLNDGTMIRADIDGRVNQLPYAEGESFTAGSILVQVADFTHVEMDFRVDEYNINKIYVGMPVTVTIDSLNENYESTVASIDYTGMATRSVTYYTCKVYVDVGENVNPGMQVTITVKQTLAENALYVSKDALTFDEKNQASVYVLQDDGETMVAQSVELGAATDDYVVITSGVTAGQTVYAKVDVSTTSTGIFSLLTMGTGSMGGGGGMPSGGSGNMPSFDSGNMPSFSGGGSGGGGGGFGGGGGGFPN